MQSLPHRNISDTKNYFWEIFLYHLKRWLMHIKSLKCSLFSQILILWHAKIPRTYVIWFVFEFESVTEMKKKVKTYITCLNKQNFLGSSFSQYCGYTTGAKVCMVRNSHRTVTMASGRISNKFKMVFDYCYFLYKLQSVK